MKKLPKFLSKLRESEKVETMGRTARRRQGVFFGRLGVPERSGAGAAGSGRCAVGVCFSERAAAGRWAGPAGGHDAAREPAQKAAAGCVFQWGAARSTAGAVRAPEGSGGEVNAVGTTVRALVEAPVGFEKALEGIGCGAGEVGRGGGVGVSTSAAARVGSAGGRAEVGSIGRSGGIEERRNGGAGRRHRHAVPPVGEAEGTVAAGAGRVRAQRSSSTSTTGRVWRLKVLPLPNLMGITVAR